MAQTRNLVLFGAGNIGSEMNTVLGVHGYAVDAVVRSSSITIPKGKGLRHIKLKKPGNPAYVMEEIRNLCPSLDGVVSAIPGGDGTFEFGLMNETFSAGLPFVTAAKVAIAKNYPALVPHLPMLGRMATVGGGTMMLDFMSKHLSVDDGSESEVYAVVNGTMSYVMTNRWRNRPMPAILHECMVLKLAEPMPNGGTPEPRKLFDCEIDDVVWKLMIMLDEHYRFRIGRAVRLEDFRKVALTDRALQRYLAPNSRRKFVVRITTREMEPEIDEDDPGSIWASIENKVFVSGGFYEIPAGSALAGWVPDIGPGNAIQIEQGGNLNGTSGDGAGPYATCKSLLHDVQKLIPL